MRTTIISVCLLLTACGQPVQETRTVDERPSILVRGAPSGAVLQVDGLVAGSIVDNGGTSRAIRIEPGTHVVAVVVNGRSILTERLFVNGRVTKTLTVPDGGIHP